MTLLDMAYVPAAKVAPDATVHDAVARAMSLSCDAVAVVDGERLTGILTSRDVLLKVVLRQLSAESVAVQQVMTTPVITLHPQTEPNEALELMLEKQIRHIALSEDGTTVCGMLSLRKLLNSVVMDQRDDLDHLAAFLMADGPGG